MIAVAIAGAMARATAGAGGRPGRDARSVAATLRHLLAARVVERLAPLPVFLA
jgi:hypothetical protein